MNQSLWYRAIPKWTSEYGNIQGDTRYITGHDDNNFVKTTELSYNDLSGTIGYFAQGKWAFDIEVRKPIVDATNNTTTYAVLWKTTTEGGEIRYINETENNLEFKVTKYIDSSKSGTVEFDVSTNKKSKEDFFTVSWKKISGTESESGDIDGLIPSGTGNDETADTAKITGSKTLNAGFYAITVKYYSAVNKLVGSSTVAAEVIPGGKIKVEGTIENQTYQETVFEIKGMYKLGVSVVASQTTGEKVVGKDADNNDIKIPTIVAGQPIKFTATPSLTDLVDSSVTVTGITYYYIWDNGTATTTAEYTTTPAAPGDFYCDCIAYAMDGDSIIGSASFNLKFVAEVPAP